MARKKGLLKNKPLILAAGGGGLVFAALVAIFVLGFGIDTLPVIDAESVIQRALTVDEVNENTQIMIDIDKVINDPDSACTATTIALTECLTLTQGEITVPIAPNVDPSTFIQCGITEEDALQCDAEIQQIIMDLNNQLNDPPPITNDTDSSPSPVIDQICDILELDCGPKPPIKLTTLVLKTDSFGITDEVETTFDVPQLSFFIEDIINGTRDFRTGQLEMILFMTGEPFTLYTGSATLDVTIGSEVVRTIPILIDTTTDADGFGQIQFIGPTGAPSPFFLFQFEPNFDKFLNEQATLLDFIVKDFLVDFVDPETGIQFGIADTSIFSMTIARDDIKLLVIDEQGQNIRVYPSDSRIVLSTVTGRTPSYTTCTTQVQTFSSTFYGNGLGCSQPFLVSTQGNGVDCISSIRSNKGISIPPPTISGISVKDSEGNILIAPPSGSGTVLDYNLLTRNQNYTLSVSSLNIVSSDLEYGKTAQTKSFSCSQEGTARLTTSRTNVGNCAVACGSCAVYTGIILNIADPVIEGAISCNIP